MTSELGRMKIKDETSSGKEVESACDNANTAEGEDSSTEDYDADTSTNNSFRDELKFELKSNEKAKTQNQLENDIITDDIPFKNKKAKNQCISNSMDKTLERKVNELPHIKSESPTSSASLSVCLPNNYKTTESEKDLRLDGSLLKTFLNHFIVSNQSFKALNSFDLIEDSSRDNSRAQSVSFSLNHIEKFRMVSECDSILSLNSSNLSCCSEDSDYGLVKVRYDTSSSSSSASYLESTSSFLRHQRSLSRLWSSFDKSALYPNEVEETESPFSDKESSSNDNTKDAVSLCNASSFTKEFQNDIDFLARSEFRTSTPDPKEKKSPKSVSNSFTDSFTLQSNKKFVHGVSPLCGTHSSSAARAECRTEDSVRRSLVYGSPKNKRAILPRPECSKRSNELIKHLNDSRLSSHEKFLPKTDFKNDPVLPKIMFQDETEEAVYYLITKYLNSDSECKW